MSFLLLESQKRRIYFIMSEFFKQESREIKAPVAETEKFFDFNEFGLHGEWLKITTTERKTVEGAYYKSEKSNGEMVIFHPGLPGDAVGTFEENFVKHLLDQGYDIFVARHNGLKNQKENEKLYHNKHRIEYDENISGQPMDWFNEPQVSISFFAQQNKSITLITHSFSGILAANSFIEMNKNKEGQELVQRVKKWILPSASIWNMKGDNMLDIDRKLSIEDIRNYCDYFIKIYSIPLDIGSDQLLEEIKAILNKIDTEIGKSIPENMEIIGVYPENDKLVSPNIGINFVKKLPRGIILRDKHVPINNDEDPHDFRSAQAVDLARIIKMKTSKSKHIFDINK